MRCVSRPVTVLPPDLLNRLRQLAEGPGTLGGAAVAGDLLSLKFKFWTTVTMPAVLAFLPPAEVASAPNGLADRVPTAVPGPGAPAAVLLRRHRPAPDPGGGAPGQVSFSVDPGAHVRGGRDQ